MAVKVFVSYSHTDDELRAQLEEHLAQLQREGRVEAWTDRRIPPGNAWGTAIDEALEAAEVVLLLVSSSFLASDYCNDVELKRALKRHEEGTARVIPVIVRPCDWRTASFGKLQALPRDFKPVSKWEDRDDAWLDVVGGIRRQVTPPSRVVPETDRSWLLYSAWLERQAEEPILDSAFSLREIYVPIRVYWEQTVSGRIRRPVEDLEVALTRWLDKPKPADAVRVLSGGPGSGKSSFAKFFAARLARRSALRVLYVPLHHLKPKGELSESLEHYAKQVDYLPLKPIDRENSKQRLVIFFDGLDELVVPGQSAHETIRKFVREVHRSIRSFNAVDTRLQVVLGGREIVVQSIGGEFRPRQILHLLGYFVPENERHRYHDPRDLLAQDARNCWWKEYGRLTRRGYAGFPEELAEPRLLEVTAQPLLNHLFALSYDRGRVDFTSMPNLNVIYGDLLSEVYNWHCSKVTLGISEGDFLRILEQIALAAWHGHGRTTTAREIEEHCTHAGLKRILDQFEEGARDGITRMLTAFYFRQKGYSGDDKTFEFTHKSFSEYLVARRLVGMLDHLQRQRERQRQDPEESWREIEAVTEWAEICGPSPMEPNLFDCLRNECRIRGQETCRGWQLLLQELLDHVLRHGIPMERVQPRPATYLAETRQARNAEEALWAALASSAVVSGTVSQVRWPGAGAFGSRLANLQAQRTGIVPLIPKCLSYLGLAGANLVRASLDDAILDGADLSRASLDGAALERASLIRARLDRATLFRTSLKSANLDGASLERAILDEASLERANLDRANLERATLDRTVLDGASLVEASLQGASLAAASLLAANFERATLDGADLEGAALIRATLKRASLAGASLIDAILVDVQLDGARLDGASLDGASLIRARLDGAYLAGASLIGARLDGARLQGARDLAQEQIDSAHGDSHTQLPAGLERPVHWS